MDDIVMAKAFAKVNLTLDVLGRRPDGYHEIEMIMQSVDLADELVVHRRHSEGGDSAATPSCHVRITGAGFHVPTGPTNIIWKAAEAFAAAYRVGVDVDVNVKKRIPVAAGLAGGSADAAATLTALASLYRVETGMTPLASVGVRVGADVPFCLAGGTCLVRGLGEAVTPLAAKPRFLITLCKPPFGVSTADAYRWFDAMPADSVQRPRTDEMCSALVGGGDGEEAGSAKACGRLLVNVLEAATVPRHPELERIKSAMRAHGFAGVVMSGSGPTVFGISDGPGPGARFAADPVVRELGLSVWPDLSLAASGVVLGGAQ